MDDNQHHWMQKASERMKKKGTVGSFTRTAKREGKSVPQLAIDDYNKPGREGERARYAYMAEHRSWFLPREKLLYREPEQRTQQWVCHLTQCFHGRHRGERLPKLPFDQVMKKWKAGQLHSGGPGGPVVHDQKQAEVIMLSEKKKAAAGDSEYASHPMRNSLGRRKG